MLWVAFEKWCLVSDEMDNIIVYNVNEHLHHHWQAIEDNDQEKITQHMTKSKARISRPDRLAFIENLSVTGQYWLLYMYICPGSPPCHSIGHFRDAIRALGDCYVCWELAGRGLFL
jgi:hypothetical protein